MNASFGDVYAQLCERYPDPHERGRQFEPLMLDVLRTEPLYRDRYAEAWRWDEWPGKYTTDIGVDIVAQRFDGRLTAIQCKCYDPDSKLYIDDLASFLANTNAAFGERLIVSTTPNWSDKLLALISNQQPPVQRLDLFGLEATRIDWDAYLEDEAKPLRERPRKEVRDHQQRALDDVRAGFAEHDRGKLIMACGTGKTFTALRAAEEAAGRGGRVLFAAPSISLVAQALREWAADAETPLRAFAVCSDPKVGKDDEVGARAYDLPIPATTDPVRLAEAATPDARDRLTVVFSTYQSMDVIRRAQDEGMPDFDIAVCDEAHRTTGYALEGEERSHFLTIHEGEAIRARKRLYMTATPRLYNPASSARQRKPTPLSLQWTTSRPTDPSFTGSASRNRWRGNC
ncbi:MAG: DEAD/DEAH box helicase family protein [Gammaproteobacteria bacterium]|nr:DEAD/DEAH box helicase family protein [Gammaproteobacteria bacterium]